MLVRLKRVDVYDNCVTYSPLSQSVVSSKWPEYDDMLTTKFYSDYLVSKYENFSPAHVCLTSDEVNDIIVSHNREEDSTSEALVILSKTASCDMYHHCDVCRFYREGIANTVTEACSYQLFNFGKEQQTIDLQVIIPPIHMKYFVVNNETKVMTSLLLQNCGPDVDSLTTLSRSRVKTPILMMSSSGDEEG